MESSVSMGQPILVEDIGESIDPLLEPLITKRFYTSDDDRLVIKLSEREITYDENFRLYLTTKMSNPHYLPEVTIKVNIINFTVTFPGLVQ